jgi:Lanthionine-containing peptide SapB precursor RamS
MAILDLQDMKVPETRSVGSNRSNNRCGGGGGGGSRLSLLLC